MSVDGEWGQLQGLHQYFRRRRLTGRETFIGGKGISRQLSSVPSWMVNFRLADYTGVGPGFVEMRPGAGYDVVRYMSEDPLVGDTR
jgi:hypothetical protein